MTATRVLFSALIITTLFSHACSTYVPAEPGAPLSRRRTAREGGEPSATGQVVGRSVLGKPIRAHTFGNGGETSLILGVVHGNEPLTWVVLGELVRRLSTARSTLTGRRIVIVPVLNPDGLEQSSRHNARGVDLNRNFPSRSWRSGRRHGRHPRSEPETAVVMDLIRRYRPSRILAVHSPLHCVNYDGPAESIARRMARAMRYPLRPSIGYPTPGSLGSYAGADLGIPVVTLELRKTLRASEAWREAGPGLLEFVRRRPAARATGSARHPWPSPAG